MEVNIVRFIQNMLLQFEDGRIIRVLNYNPITSIIYVIEMDKKRWAFPMDAEVVRALHKSEELRIIYDDPFLRIVSDEELSYAEKKKRDQAWEIVKKVLDSCEEKELIFISKYRERAIKDALLVFNVNYSTIKNTLIKFWQGGSVKNALIPNYYKSGAKGKEKRVSKLKRGRPRKTGSKQGINVDEQIKKIFKVTLNRYYYSAKQISLKTCYEFMLKDFFTIETINHKGINVPVLHDQIPSYTQFLYWFKKMNNPKKEVATRHGSRIYYQKHRPIIGSSTYEAELGPAVLWQTDSTPLDIHLVSDMNRNILVGKPLLHLVVDVYSHLIVGFSLSFESLNSYSGAMMALFNSMTPKKEFCKKYGIDIEDDWNVACVPQKIFTDKGELNGKHIENAIENLGISIQNAPSYRADLKGVIESALKQLQSRVTPHVDGAINNGKRIRERGEFDTRLKANLSICEVMALLIKCIVFYNNHHVLQDYVLTEEMVEEGVEKIPRKIWEFGLNNKKGQLRKLPEDFIRMCLLPNDIATVKATGVSFKKMLYTSGYSLQQNWFQNARMKGSSRIKIWYDPRDLSAIYVKNDEGNGFHQLNLVEHLSKYKIKSLEEIEQIIKYEQSADSISKEKELQEKMKLFDDIEKIVEEGRQKTEAERDDSQSKTQRLKGIKENQRQERIRQRELDRKEEQFTESKKNAKGVGDKVENELDLFRRLRE